MAYDTEHVGEIYAVNVPGRQNWEKLSKNEGKEIVSKYRWIYANASCKDLYEANDEATKLSNAVGRPLVLVYMPRNISDGTRNECPGQFHASMHAPIERALSDRKELLVTARSYGVHQALRAVRKFDSPLIFLIGKNLLVIENIPLVDCPLCGESYLTADTLHEIERVKLHRQSFAVERPVAVANFT